MLNKTVVILNKRDIKLYFHTSILLVAQLFSKVSDRLLVVGISWYIIEHHNKQALAWFFTITMLPHLFLVFFSGQLIRKWSPLNIILYAEFARGLIYLILSFFTFSDKNFTLLFLALGTLLASFATALFNPALLIIPKQIDLKKSDKIIAMLNSCDSSARLIGPIIAIPIYALINIKGLLFITGISYMFAWFAECFIKLDNKLGVLESKKLQDVILHPFRLLKKYQLIMYLILTFFLTNIFLVPLQIFMPIIVKEFYCSNIALLSYFEISLGSGLLVGGFILSVYSLRSKIWYQIVIPYILAGLSYLLFSYSKVSDIALLSLFLLGLFLAIGNISTLNFFQKYINDNDLPDMMTYVNFVSTAVGPIAMALSGLFLNIITTQKLVSTYALLCLGIGLTMLFYKDSIKLKQVTNL